MSEVAESLEAAVERVLARVDGPLRVGAPLGLGKPHRLLNALYRRVAREPSRELLLLTALSLDLPQASSELERRFLEPFVRRHFGADFERLEYVVAQGRDALPANVRVEEFYLRSGSMLGSRQAQRSYTSLNYTHVARGLVERGVNCIVQRVARGADGRLSLSCNPDTTLDAVDAFAAAGRPRPLLVAEVDPRLPWLGGVAAVAADWFDVLVEPPPPHPLLFAPPRLAVGDADWAVGLYASALVRDGGTLQIGIGALADALCHALVLRHTDNATYRRVLRALDPELERHPAVVESGGLGSLPQGLYGCSEMISEGFRTLVERGVLRRRVVEDEPLMRRVVEGTASPADLARVEREGEFLHGAFYLGSRELYDWLAAREAAGLRGVGMRRVSEVNELYGGHESLERLQRRDARFFNACMLATALGAAVSDALEDGRVVSGVGGQYNFVAMAHALRDARSVLMLRATREARGRVESNLRWSYGHTTIPRHLRDVYVTEHGLADVRGACDEDCVRAMLSIADARFAPGLLEEARRARKVARDAHTPARTARNTPADLRARLAPFRADGTLPDYPLGCDFDAVEQR
ncbi:MAG TPA: acetyl-CoA hydrolase/transferase C-terminal domain-containing protein, partial [Planctomycetota bacterium]|nr:acetyl-CoA hydrolase/transferase C-terminal domain-containing protein [Planctomycetota bacterium]